METFVLRILGYQERITALQDSLKSSESAREKQKNSYESTIVPKDAIIKELSNKLAHMAAVAAHDGRNTGTTLVYWDDTVIPGFSH